MNKLNKNLVPFVPLVHGTNGTNGTNDFRFLLEKGSKKHRCPGCGKKTFVRYLDTEKNDYLPEQFGRCDRESKCSYFLNPYSNGYAIEISEREKGSQFNNWKTPKATGNITPRATPEPVFFDIDTFKRTLEPEHYKKNNFIQNLLSRVNFPFELDRLTKVIQLYYLGTIATGYRAGAITFPFIDRKGNVRTVQVKQFNENNSTTGTDFLHSIIEKHHNSNKTPLPDWLKAYIKQDKRVTCLFGEHLLTTYPTNPVALVEAPKTAVYGTLYFGLPEIPENFIWLAVYNKSSFSFDKLKVLAGRKVFVFPDLSEQGTTYQEWETKAQAFEKQLPGTRFIFSDLLEQLAPEKDKSKGLDLADYLIKQDWRLFKKQPKPQTTIQKTPTILSTNQPEQPEYWNEDISELEKFFSVVPLPTRPIKLNSCSTVYNCPLFIETHLETVKANNGNRSFSPYLDRLKELQKALTQNVFEVDCLNPDALTTATPENITSTKF